MTYTIHVQAVSGSGTGTAAFSDATTETASTVVPNPCEIVCLDVATTSLRITWGGADNAFVSTIATLSNGAQAFNRPANFAGLTPGQEYEITLTCTDSTGFATSSTQTKRTVPNPPRSLNCSPIDPVTCRCTWSTPSPPGIFGEYELSWYEEASANPLTATSKRISVPTTTGEIPSLNPSTRYVMRVATVSGFGAGEEVSSTTIETTKTTSAIQACRMFIRQVDCDSITVLFGPLSTASGYLLSLNPPPNSGAANINLQQEDVLEHTYNDLTSGTEYMITLTCLGGLNPSSQIEVRTNPPNVGQVSLSGTTSSTSVEISWAAAPGFPFDYYEVFYRDPDTGARISAAQVTTGEDLQYRLEKLDPSTTYTVEVEAVLAATGNFPRQSSCAVSSLEVTTVDVPPNTLLVRDFNTNDIEILWANIDGATQYTVLIWPTAQNKPTSSGTFVMRDDDAAFNDFTFRNLVCGRLYTAEVAAIGVTAVLQTQQRTVPCTPSSINVGSITATSALVTWSPSSGVVSSYRVSYRRPMDDALTKLCRCNYNTFTVAPGEPATKQTIHSDTSANPCQIIIRSVTTDPQSQQSSVSFTWGAVTNQNFNIYIFNISPQDGTQQAVVQEDDPVQEVTFSNLFPGRMYTIACSTDAVGFTPQSLSLRTKPLPPTSIQCISNQDILTLTSVGILWNSPNTATSEVDGFAVYYNIDNGPRNDRPLLPASATQDVITGLFPATEYTIFVATVAGTGGFQERSDPVPLNNGLKCSTETPNPGEIVCLDVTTTSLYFTWGDASGSYGDFISYLVQVTEDQMIRIGTVDVNNRLATFIGLTPGEEYCITVRILLEFSNDVTETDCKRTSKTCFDQCCQNFSAPRRGALTRQAVFQICLPAYRYSQRKLLLCHSPSLSLHHLMSMDSSESQYRADGATSFIPHEDISSSMTGPVTSEIPGLDPNTPYTIQVETLSGTGNDEVGSAPRTVDGRTGMYTLTWAADPGCNG
ncbi:fibronectin-like [Amphiura filiformis]|uniref:fibronectin-like n=1 Tax=Amphiura filiformis TaxID=82378 RepID=UPI003B216195